MTLKEKIRTSFTTQLTLWVASFVLITSSVFIYALGSYSQDIIHDESMDAMQQQLENAALQIDNRLRQAEITARLEKQQLTADREMIEQLVNISNYTGTIRQRLPNATLKVVEGRSTTSDTDVYTAFEPIGQRTFGLEVTIPKSDITDKYWRMQSVLLLWGVVSVIVLFLLLYAVVGRHLRPLHRLADAAQAIADGDLLTPIPDAHHKHESGRLQTSLKKMQQSLKAYMDEMQQKQAALSAQNAELQAAYGEAQAYEKLKEKFLTDMTEQMAEPVKTVCQNTEAICRDYLTTTKAEIARRQMDIMQATETITQLLDHLTNNTLESTPKTQKDMSL